MSQKLTDTFYLLRISQEAWHAHVTVVSQSEICTETLSGLHITHILLGIAMTITLT